MDKNLASETLLVVDEKEKGKPTVKVATGGLDNNGNPQTVPPWEKNNPDFLQINKHENALENFFSNFMRQCKNPTQFTFFKLPTDGVEQMATVIGDIIKNGYESGRDLLDAYRVKPEDYQNKQDRQQKQNEEKAMKTPNDTKEKQTAISEHEVDWSNLGKLGISKEMLKEKNCLEILLNYGKSPLLPVKMELDGVSIDTQARLAFRKGDDDKLTVSVHGVRAQPELDKPFYGHKFTDDEKKTLWETGNLGKVLDLQKNDGTTLPVYVSIDKLTNEVIALRADKVKIPGEIKGVTLDERQKQDLQEGKAVWVENMTNRNGKSFSAHLQVNADKKGLEFIFSDQAQNQQNSIQIPSKLGGVNLSEQQQAELKAEKTIYVEGLTDTKEEKYNAYIKVNPEKGKLDFFKWNPDKAQEKTPDNTHQTQQAVNSQGKTNEATKNVNEPLKPGQTQPDEKQSEVADSQQKSKGLKV